MNPPLAYDPNDPKTAPRPEFERAPSSSRSRRSVCWWSPLSWSGVGINTRDSDPYYILLTVACFGSLVTGITALALSGRTTSKALPIAGGIISIVFACGGWIVGIVVISLTHLFEYTGGSGGGRRLRRRVGPPVTHQGQAAPPVADLRLGLDAWRSAQPGRARRGHPPRARSAVAARRAKEARVGSGVLAGVRGYLAAAGGPADSDDVVRTRAAMEEIEHTKACFALAAGYGGRSFTVQPMPDILIGGLDSKADRG